MDNYTSLAADYHFKPTAVETLGPIKKSGSDFLTVLAHNIGQRSGDERETVFFYFSAFLFCFSDSTAFCFTIRLFVRTV